MYLVLSALTSSPISLVAATKASFATSIQILKDLTLPNCCLTAMCSCDPGPSCTLIHAAPSVIVADSASLISQAHSAQRQGTASQSRRITSAFPTKTLEHDQASDHATTLDGILGNTGSACTCL